MQVYGGYGYMKDYPVEQFLRDEKAHSIFEGTNGIQALTLADRHLGRNSETLFKGHLHDIKKFCNENRSHKALGGYVEILEKATEALSEVSSFLVSIYKKDFPGLALYATPYLDLFGDVTAGWLLLWQAVIAQDRLNALAKEKGMKPDELKKLVAENSNAAFYSGKLASARFFASTVLSLADSKAQVIKRMDRTALEISENAF
jgi:hypothetical protein